MNNIALDVKELVKYYPVKSGVIQKITNYVRSVDGVSFSIPKGKTFGLVGESGCGKTTIGRTIIRLTEPTSGQAILDGKDLFKLNSRELIAVRPKIQMIFQDPYSSLNPRMPVAEIIGEAVREHKIVDKKNVRDYVLETMESCGLMSYFIDRYPHEFSGGQRQRICIARALALRPSVVIADEPVSALDVSIQAQVINLMKDLQEKQGLTYLFISHDLSVVEYLSDMVGVMYLGNLVELATKKEIFKNPMHPYTKALLSAIPIPNPAKKMNRIILKGDIPSASNPPNGCKFHTRCPNAMKKCEEIAPKWKSYDKEHLTSCHLYEQ